jgi:hypothetical protein
MSVIAKLEEIYNQIVKINLRVDSLEERTDGLESIGINYSGSDTILDRWIRKHPRYVISVIVAILIFAGITILCVADKSAEKNIINFSQEQVDSTRK